MTKILIIKRWSREGPRAEQRGFSYVHIYRCTHQLLNAHLHKNQKKEVEELHGALKFNGCNLYTYTPSECLKWSSVGKERLFEKCKAATVDSLFRCTITYLLIFEQPTEAVHHPFVGSRDVQSQTRTPTKSFLLRHLLLLCSSTCLSSNLTFSYLYLTVFRQPKGLAVCLNTCLRI